MRDRFSSLKDLDNPIVAQLCQYARVPLIHGLVLDGRGPVTLDITKDALTHADAYVRTRYEENRPWLVLCGVQGLGKSLAACWVLEQEFVERLSAWEVGNRAAGFPPTDDRSPFPGPPGRFVTARDIVRAAPWGGEMQAWSEMMGTLVLDDLDAGWQDGKEAFLGKVEDLLLERYNGLRPTVITTNLPVKALAERYPRVLDRARQVGKAYELTGASMRAVGQ